MPDTKRARIPVEKPVYITRGLLEALLSLAAEHEPNEFSADLGTTPAGEFTEDVDPTQPVVTHFYLPDTGGSVSAVFGFDLGIGPGQSKGRFIAHPDGEFAVRSTDDLHARMLVAVPPWDRDSVAAFDRSGRRQPLTVVDEEPPVGTVP